MNININIKKYLIEHVIQFASYVAPKNGVGGTGGGGQTSSMNEKFRRRNSI